MRLSMQKHKKPHLSLSFVLVAFCLVTVDSGSAPTRASSTGASELADLIGKQAPEFAGLDWMGGKPYTLKELRGTPVLIRFWNRHCDMCKDSAPILEDLHKKYSKRGLHVIGIHHKKTAQPDTAEQVTEQARKWQMSFPIAIDNDWVTVKRLWMHRDRSMTSATILIDKNGTIDWIHPGGTLRKTDQAALEKIIEKQLSSL